jgi:hypothetical protein
MAITKKVVAGQTIAAADFSKFFGDHFSEFVKTGFEVTEGTGVIVDISAGTAYVKDADGYMFQIVSNGTETLTLTDDATNYVFLHSDNGATFLTDSTSASVPTDAIMLATVVCASGDVTSVTDNRVLAPIVPTPAILTTYLSNIATAISRYYYLNPAGNKTITLGKIYFEENTDYYGYDVYYNVGAGEVEVSSGDIIGASNSNTAYNVYIKIDFPQPYLLGRTMSYFTLEYTIQ